MWEKRERNRESGTGGKEIGKERQEGQEGKKKKKGTGGKGIGKEGREGKK
jgi:hypothetical protein